jgi:2-oxoisovalerate dehydrogenase E2 component (dihydrolipoyl transacylase)
MSEPKVFLLPDLGEGLTEAELVNWLVAVGDEIRVDQPIAEVETAKSMVEVPSPYAGTVAELHGEPGQTLDFEAPGGRACQPDFRSREGCRRPAAAPHPGAREVGFGDISAGPADGARSRCGPGRPPRLGSQRAHHAPRRRGRH